MEKAEYAMNYLDFGFFAMENVVLSQGQLITVRFRTQHTAEEMKHALKHILSLYPRVRCVVVPTLFSYAFRVLDDQDPQFTILFDDAFRIQPRLLYNSTEYLAFRRDLLNEPFNLEQGLPIKMRYLVDDQNPVLLISIHHMVCSGLGYGHMLNALLAYMNGKNPSAISAHNPSAILHAHLVRPWYKIPKQLLKSFRHALLDARETKGDRVISPSPKPSNFYGPTDMHTHVLPYRLECIQQKSKTLGCSITAILLAALSLAISRLADRGKGNTISMTIPMDISANFYGEKPIFGNNVSAIVLRVPNNLWDTPREMIQHISTRLEESMESINNRDIIFNILIEKLFTLIGRKFYSHFIRTWRGRGVTFRTNAFSNIGNVDILNSHGSQAQICEYISTTSYHGLFIVLATLEGQFNLSFSYPEAEFSRDEIRKLIHAFEGALEELLAL